MLCDFPRRLGHSPHRVPYTTLENIVFKYKGLIVFIYLTTSSAHIYKCNLVITSILVIYLFNTAKYIMYIPQVGYNDNHGNEDN